MTSDAPARPRAASFGYVAAVLLLPLLVLWARDNALFTGFGYVDPWIYFGYFRNLAEFKRSYPGLTFGAHLSWLLPGAALHSIFPPVVAGATLHLGVHWMAALSLFSCLSRLAGPRRAFLTTMVFSAYPWTWHATGADDVQGIAIAWCLLSLALLTRAASTPTRGFTLLAAGAAFAAFVYSNSDWIFLSPLVPLYYLGLRRAWDKPATRRSWLIFCAWFGAGCLLVTAALSAVNYRLDGHPFFYASAVVAALTEPASYSWRSGLWNAGGPTPWLLLPAVAAILGIRHLRAVRRDPASRLHPAAVLAAILLAAIAALAIGQLRGHAMLGSPFHSAILLPFSFLLLGCHLWPQMDDAAPIVPRRYYLLFCAALAIALSRSWLFDTGYMVRNAGWFGWLGGAALLASLIVKRLPDAPLLALAGFCVFTALGISPAYSVEDPHAFRNQYDSVSRARQQIEDIRRDAPIRFWLDRESTRSSEIVALAASYIRMDDLDHPTTCDAGVAPAVIIAAVSEGAGDCLSARRLRAVRIGTAGARIFLFRVEDLPDGSR